MTEQAGTQNQGNTLGARSCVRQSKLYREYESGNNVKDILGTPNLRWDTNKKEGAYKGHGLYDHNIDGYRSNVPQGRRGYEKPRNRDYDYNLGGTSTGNGGSDDSMLPESRRIGNGWMKQASRMAAPSVSNTYDQRSVPRAPVVHSRNEEPSASDGPGGISDDDIRAMIELEAMKRMQSRLEKERAQINATYQDPVPSDPTVGGSTRMAVRYDSEGNEVRRTYSDGSPNARRSNAGNNSSALAEAAAKADYHLAEYEKYKRMSREDVPAHFTSGIAAIGSKQSQIMPSARRMGIPSDGSDGGALSVVGRESGGFGSSHQWVRSSADIGGIGVPLKHLGKPWEALAPTTSIQVHTGRNSHAPKNGMTRPW